MLVCEIINYIFIVVIVLGSYVYLIQRNKFQELEEIHSTESKLLKKAYFDPLTLLPSHQNVQTILKEQISRCHRQDKSFDTALIKVSDSSDEVIKEAGLRIFDSVREEDVVGHISKDLFVIIFNEYLKESDVETVLNRTKHAFEKVFITEIQNNTLKKISIDIEIKTYPKKSTVEELMSYTPQ